MMADPCGAAECQFAATGRRTKCAECMRLDRVAYVASQLADVGPEMTQAEREEYEAFLYFQHGGLVAIGEGIRRRGRRHRPTGMETK